MPFGTPTLGPEDPTYTMAVGFASPPSDPPHAVLTVVSAAGASTVGDMDALMQLLVDWIDSSSDLVATSATRTKLSIQEVTATP